ncbi:MAG TPA: capsule assembly Wzi family protein [Daejeonella sp.]|nr:capsule assembly Wzi family protein [Daejeonella sp.]
MKKLLYLFIFTFLSSNLLAQTLPVGTPLLEEYYQIAHLNGELDSTISFTVRPLSLSAAKNIFNPEDEQASWLKWDGVKTFAHGKGKLQILPFSWQSQYNSHHPYGWNDGSMIPAKGYQTQVSAGIYAQWGPLSVQLRPELVWAANKEFEGFNTEHADITWWWYYWRLLNLIDLPERFGDEIYRKASWGQSSIRLNFDPISIGLSNENLWWGPGKRNSLIMSNNAPGFKHLTLNTIRPIKTPIGSLEGQIVAGRLESSGFLPPEPNRIAFGFPLYWPKTEDWRYLSGFTLTYQPKWVPGLFLGITRVFQMYHNDMDGRLDDYIPFFQAFQKSNTSEGEKERDQLASVFAKYLLKESKAEIYFEFGRNDHSMNLRDFLMEPEHSRAYMVGFSKLFTLPKKDEFILANLEFTQLSQANSSLIRDAGAWYVHVPVRQGYTHQGKVIGAGIGPGSNLQSMSLSWHRGLKNLGLQFERYVHNNDFYFDAFAHSGDYRKRWVDLSMAATAGWNYKNLLINAKFSTIRSLNYQYWLIDRPWEHTFLQSGQDLFNFQGQLGLTYRF